MSPRILEILDTKGFVLTIKWTNGEIRNIDFFKFIADFPKIIKDSILRKETFATLELNKISRTLSFPELLPFINEKGNKELGELDFCPDVLYSNSTPLISNQI